MSPRRPSGFSQIIFTILSIVWSINRRYLKTVSREAAAKLDDNTVKAEGDLILNFSIKYFSYLEYRVLICLPSFCLAITITTSAILLGFYTVEVLSNGDSAKRYFSLSLFIRFAFFSFSIMVLILFFFDIFISFIYSGATAWPFRGLNYYDIWSGMDEKY